MAALTSEEIQQIAKEALLNQRLSIRTPEAIKLRNGIDKQIEANPNVSYEIPSEWANAGK